MAKHWESPLMWAHYADSHSGVCLDFDVLDGAAMQMNYEPDRKQHLLDLAQPRWGLKREHLEQLLTTKYAQWAYEEEWRLILGLEDKDPENGEYYLNFGEQLALREIIVGARCKSSVDSFKKLLGQVEQSVTIIKARPAFEDFKIVRQQQVKAIVVPAKRP